MPGLFWPLSWPVLFSVSSRNTGPKKLLRLSNNWLPLSATVLREDEELVVPAREVVPGDILLMHTGDRVAADARLLEVVNLMVDEAILTGESTPATKSEAPAPAPDTPIADQHGMLFGGTVVTYGRGRAVVTATGMDTEFGRIAQMLGEVRAEKTPLEKRISLIGRVLSIICLAVAAGAFFWVFIRGSAGCPCSFGGSAWPWPRCRNLCRP